MKNIIRKTKIEKRIAIIILMILMFILLYDVGINAKRLLDCRMSIDKENILQYVEFVGPVSDINKENVEKVLQEEVSEEALNFIINSGGAIKVVYSEERNVRDYLNEAYGFSLPKTSYGIDGITIPYRDPLGNLCKTDVVIYANGILIGELGHELGHVYDLSHNILSEQDEFMKKIYNNRSIISKKAMSQAVAYRDYYESNPKEYFAELYKRYCRGDFKEGVNEETDTVLEYFNSLELQ